MDCLIGRGESLEIEMVEFSEEGRRAVTYVVRSVINSTLEFIENGPVMASFESWTVEINDSFVNRHALLHGRHDANAETNENSIKLLCFVSPTVAQIGRQIKQHRPGRDTAGSVA